MYTRKQYMDKECTHSDYYGQFVDQGVISRVTRLIGKDRILKSTDPHFNDIPLRKWDNTLIPVPHQVAEKMRECGDYPTLAGAVCVAKQAARQIKEG